MGIFAGGLQILYSAIKVRCFLWSPFLNIAIFALAGFFAFTYFIKGASVKQGLQD